MQSLTEIIKQVDREIKGVLRRSDTESLSPEKRKLVGEVKLAGNEARLDIRDYEFAQTRREQLQAAKLARHNLTALESRIIALDDLFDPADIAALSARIQLLREGLE